MARPQKPGKKLHRGSRRTALRGDDTGGGSVSGRAARRHASKPHTSEEDAFKKLRRKR